MTPMSIIKDESDSIYISGYDSPNTRFIPIIDLDIT